MILINSQPIFIKVERKTIITIFHTAWMLDSSRRYDAP